MGIVQIVQIEPVSTRAPGDKESTEIHKHNSLFQDTNLEWARAHTTNPPATSFPFADLVANWTRRRLWLWTYLRTLQPTSTAGIENGDEIDSPPECAILAPVSLGRWGIVFSPQNCPRNERPNRRRKSTEARLGYLVPSAVRSAVPCAVVRPSFRASSYASVPGLPQLRSLEAPRWSSRAGHVIPRPSGCVCGYESRFSAPFLVLLWGPHCALHLCAISWAFRKLHSLEWSTHNAPHQPIDMWVTLACVFLSIAIGFRA